MSVTVFLANQGFTLPVTNVDDRRREAYFKNPTDPNYQLVPEEDKILLALGIDKQALGTLKENESSCLNGRMAEFFKQLPKCQSDSSLMLAKDCEVVHCVLWETLLAAQSRSKDMYKDNWNKKKPWGDISVAINNQILNDLKPKRENLDDVDRLFTLIMKAGVPVASPISALPSVPVPSAPVPSAPATPADVNKLFTLILPGQTEENPQPAVPSPPESTAEPENAASAITAPSVSSNSSTSTKSSWFTRKTGKTPFTKETTQVNFNRPATQPNRPSWFTRKFGKKPLSGAPGPQINLGASPNNEGPVNHPGESPFTRPSGQVPLADEETEEFQQENPMVPSANRAGESPFTQRSTEVPLGGPERGPPLGVIPTDEEINNQCEGRPRPAEREKHEEEFKRSLYFFHSIKHQEDIDLANADLNPATETKFLADWNKAIKGSRDKLAASLKFLDVPADKLVEMNGLYRNFINGGTNGVNPILAHECNKLGETAAGLLERFYETIERTPSQRTYLFQHADWPSGNGNDINMQTPTSVNAVDVSVRDITRHEYFTNEGMHHLTILTTQDIDYTENNDFDYNIQGRHITDYLLIRDLFAKNKNYVLDISPQLIYLFYRERNIPRPTADGRSVTINDAFFKNAFGGNHIPPQLASDLKVQGQVDIAYYGICNTLTVTDKKPYRFYSKPTSSKLNDIIKWLENATDQKYAPISNLMRWAVPTETPIQQAVLLDLFKSVAKKPQTFLNRMFTRKNKKNRNNATTRRNQAPPAPQEPRNALTAARAAAIGAPPQLLLEAPGVPKQKKEMDDATLRNILARAEPRPGSVAATLGIPRVQVQGQAPAPAAPAPPPASTPRPGSVAAQAAAQAAERASPPPLPIPESLPLYNSETNGTFSNTESNGESTAEATELAEEAVNNDQSIVLDMPKPSMAQKLGAFFKGKNPKPESPPSTNSNYYEPKEPTTVETWAAAQRAAMSPQEPLEKRTTLQKLKNRFFKTKKNKKPNNNGRNLTRRVVRPKIPVMPEGLSPLVTPVANLSGFSSNNPPPPSNPQREEYIRMARNIGLVEDDAIEAEKEAEARVKNNKKKYNKFLKKTPAKQSELLKKLVLRILKRKRTDLLAEITNPQEQEYTNEEKAMLASLNEEIRREQSPE
uniref:Uncharacterized protein n=1 Tax=viral metagenome TaxID=1070528 RepID=A0A6C0LM05_9ZZZZ